MSKNLKGNIDKKSDKSMPVVSSFPFGKRNYMLIIAGIVTIILGFLLMMGGGSENPNDFNEAELFSTRRITIAPAVVIIGYIVVLYAILYRPKNQ